MSNRSGSNQTDQMGSKEPLLEARKMLYGHCIDMHKVFLSWRERLLAGYATLIAALAFAYSWAYGLENSKYFSRTICISGILFTLVFWLLDRRTRALYRSCIEVGFNIERQLGVANHEKRCVGFYSIFHIPTAELKAMNSDPNRSLSAAASEKKLRRLWNSRNVRDLRWWASSHSGAIDFLALMAVTGMLVLLICPPVRSSRIQTSSKPTETDVENAPGASSSTRTR